MDTTQIARVPKRGALRAKTNSRMQESVSFTSTCPRCLRQQPQQGIFPGALRRLLDKGFPVQAYCIMCDQFWSISAGERAALATRLER